MRGRPASLSRGGTAEDAGAETNPLYQHLRKSVRTGHGRNVN